MQLSDNDKAALKEKIAVTQANQLVTALQINSPLIPYNASNLGQSAAWLRVQENFDQVMNETRGPTANSLDMPKLHLFAELENTRRADEAALSGKDPSSIIRFHGPEDHAADIQVTQPVADAQNHDLIHIDIPEEKPLPAITLPHVAIGDFKGQMLNAGQYPLPAYKAPETVPSASAPTVHVMARQSAVLRTGATGEPVLSSSRETVGTPQTDLAKRSDPVKSALLAIENTQANILPRIISGAPTDADGNAPGLGWMRANWQDHLAQKQDTLQAVGHALKDDYRQDLETRIAEIAEFGALEQQRLKLTGEKAPKPELPRQTSAKPSLATDDVAERPRSVIKSRFGSVNSGTGEAVRAGIALEDPAPERRAAVPAPAPA